MMNNVNPIILALDKPDLKSAISAAKPLVEHVGYFKVGFELFTSSGIQVIHELNKLGAGIFLDLKFHDIPNTVAGASRSVVNLGVMMCNVHASGGYDMVKAAADALAEESTKQGLRRPKLLAVTILTSIDPNAFSSELKMQDTIESAVEHFAVLSQKAGADGVIASPREIGLIRQACGPDFLIVTPGIRPKWAASNDQKRIMTPGEAIKTGANHVVIGRPILGADDPVQAAIRINDEIAGVER